MANLSGIMKQLKKERDLVERQLSGLNAALAAFVGVYGGSQVTGKRRVSAAARRKMSLRTKHDGRRSGQAKRQHRPPSLKS